MKAAIAIALIVIGLTGVAYGGVSYWHRDRIIDIGPIHATIEKKEKIPISPIVGGIAVAAGVGLLLTTKR
jgi:hypothetical protein